MEDTIATGFLYGLWDGNFIVKEGTVMKTWWCSKRDAIFKYGEHDCDWTRCSPEPGKLVRAHLWLPERDDTLSRKILIDYYMKNTERLERQIDGYQENIKILQDA